MEKEFESKLHLQNPDSNNNSILKSKSFVFRAPQEHFIIQEFQLGKIYGVGSYTKVVRAKKRDISIVYRLRLWTRSVLRKKIKHRMLSWNGLYLIGNSSAHYIPLAVGITSAR
ncbi:hypothetical protein MKX01_028963 [Papaver californicum]|nr:hypothetical protein MKX01_028963 [Papaver californicum]